VTVLLEYGLLVLFVWVFVEQAGVPLPVAPLLLAAGALAAAQQVNLLLALAVTIGASLLADLLWYVIGRQRGGQALGVLCRVTLEPDYCVRRAQDLFLKHRLRSLVLGKFLPGINPLVAGLAGVAGIGPGRFIAYDVGSAALWAGTWTGLGYLLRDVLAEVTAWLSQLGEGAIVLAVAVLLGYVAVKYAQRRRILRQLRIARIAPDDLRRKLDAGEPLLIVDLRNALDVAEVPYTIPGALRMSPDELESRHAEIPRDADIVLVCT
jgi:membrane protein DedA with SNARE-associated domain